MQRFIAKRKIATKKPVTWQDISQRRRRGGPGRTFNGIYSHDNRRGRGVRIPRQRLGGRRRPRQRPDAADGQHREDGYIKPRCDVRARHLDQEHGEGRRRAPDQRRRDVPREAEDRAARALKFGAVGCFWVGPLLTYWFNVMERFLPGRAPARVAAKLVIDQVLQGPFMIGSMFALCAAANGASMEAIQSKLETELWPTWVNSVIVWGPVQIGQQTLVPLEYRVAVANFVSYFWDTYLAHEMCGPEGCKVEDAPELAPAAAPAPLGFGERRPLAWCEASDEFAR